VGPKELDIKLEEFEARLTMLSRELDDLVKTAKDIEFRAKAILGELDKWLLGNQRNEKKESADFLSLFGTAKAINMKAGGILWNNPRRPLMSSNHINMLSAANIKITHIVLE